MNKKIAREIQDVRKWLSSQPGVTSVVEGSRPTRTSHPNPPGFTIVSAADAKGVRVRTYSPKVCVELFVYATPSVQRDRWVAALVGGQVISKSQTPSIKNASSKPQVDTAKSFSSTVPTPQAVNETAGQTFDVTPDLAAKWLERNTRNRPLNGGVVEKYATDMKAGRWMLTGDAIAFDKTGAIVNGQHRLWAVFESGLTVRMLVMFDLEPEVVRVLDDHLKRKLTDIIHIAKPGVNIQAKHTAAARQMMFSLTRTDRESAYGHASRQNQIDFLEKHIEAIEFAVRDCFKSRNHRGFTNAVILAVLARAWYTRDRQRIMAFARVLTTGMPDGPQDKAAVIFRNWLMRMTTQNVRSQSNVLLGKCERAVDAFLKNEALSTLYEASEELFPLPEEVAPGRAKVKK